MPHHHHHNEYEEEGGNERGAEHSGFPGNQQGGHQQGPPQGYQGGYQQGPPQGYQGGYQQGPPQGYQGGYQQGPPQGYQGGYQQGPPQGYQQGGGMGYQQGGSGQQHPPPPNNPQARKKSLLIGINYVGSQHALQGCHQDVENVRDFLSHTGYPTDGRSQVIMRDDRQTDPRGPMFPNGHNMLAAMEWLISEPGTCNFLHYSGHGGQVKDPDGDRDSGFDDTIVPVDFESAGQLDSDTLHRHIVSKLPPSSTLFVVFDCCHSGSAIELPYVYRTDEDGNVGLVDNLKQGMQLLGAASSLLQGGFSVSKINNARQLFAGAQSFFKSLQHRDEPADEQGLGEEHFAEDWKAERKNVWMFSGCRDDQTSADAAIAGSHVGAMSWAFLQTMKEGGPRQSYIQVLQKTRGFLQGRYKQVPQLSVGYQMDLSNPLHV